MKIELFNKNREKLNHFTKKSSYVLVYDNDVYKGKITKTGDKYNIYINSLENNLCTYFKYANFEEALQFAINPYLLQNEAKKVLNFDKIEIEMTVYYFYKNISDIKLEFNSDIMNMDFILKKWGSLEKDNNNEMFIIKENNKYITLDYRQLSEFLLKTAADFKSQPLKTVDYLIKTIKPQSLYIENAGLKSSIGVKNFNELIEVQQFFKKYF